MVARIKGILLCGGQGTRLRPMTEVINKHLVRVHDLPMAEYPLRQMISAYCKDILIVSGGENFAAVVKYFGSGRKWGVNITHAIQDEPGGIAQALNLGRNFVGHDEHVLVCLGDNIWKESIRTEVKTFIRCDNHRALLFSYKSKTPERFGVLKFDKQGRAIDVIEKPTKPPSNEILTGIYAYTPDVFEIIRSLKPSERGELEISDVNRHYIKAGQADIVKLSGWWSDCGTMETLIQTEGMIKND